MSTNTDRQNVEYAVTNLDSAGIVEFGRFVGDIYFINSCLRSFQVACFARLCYIVIIFSGKLVCSDQNPSFS